MVSKTKSKIKKGGKRSKVSKKSKPLKRTIKKPTSKKTHASAQRKKKTSRKPKSVIAAPSPASPITRDDKLSVNEEILLSSSSEEANPAINGTQENAIIDTGITRDNDESITSDLDEGQGIPDNDDASNPF
jgi:hypothetical protein